MKCEQGKCTRTATIKNDEYHPNQWLCTFHANKEKIEGRIKRKLKKTNMKKPMTAEEYFNKNYRSSTINVVKLIESYSTYLLKHHLEQFAEECKMGIYIVDNEIKETLNDYLTKNNIR